MEGFRAVPLGLGWLVACAASPPSLPDAETTSGADSGAAGSTQDSRSTDTGSATTTTTGGSDETASVPGVCGDGVVDPGEDCDDGNVGQLDGCTTTCEVGPTGLKFGPVSETELLTRGSDGGTDVMADCPEGQLLVGFEVYFTVVTNPSLTGAIGLCADPKLTDSNPTAIILEGSTALPEVGNVAGNFDPLVCEPGSAIATAGIGTGLVYVITVGASCRPLEIVGEGGGQVLQIGESAPLPPVLTGGKLETEIACPEGEVAIGLVGRQSDGFITAAGLRCASVELQYP